jgi:hypothetical protein
MKYEYDIETLIKTFQRHYDKVLEQEKLLDEKYPNRDKPSNEFDNDHNFCISLALKSICEEIITLRGWISDIEDQLESHRYCKDAHNNHYD